MVSQESVFVSLTADDARAATDDDFLRVVIDDRHVAQCFPVYLNDMAMPRRLEAAIGLEDTVDMFLRMYLRGMIALDRSDMDVVRAFFELAVKRFQLSVTPLRTPRDIVGNLSDYRCFLNSTDALMRAEHIRVAAFFADIFQNDDPLARFTYLRASDAVFYHTSRARTKEDHFVDLHSLSVALSMGDTANAKHRACMRELMRTIHADVLVAFEHRPRTKFMHKLFDAIDKVKAQLDAKKEEDGI